MNRNTLWMHFQTNNNKTKLCTSHIWSTEPIIFCDVAYNNVRTATWKDFRFLEPLPMSHELHLAIPSSPIWRCSSCDAMADDASFAFPPFGSLDRSDVLFLFAYLRTRAVTDLLLRRKFTKRSESALLLCETLSKYYL